MTAAVRSAAFSPDGKRIVTASDDKTARLWDAATGKPVGELKGHDSPCASAAFSPDGKRIVTASGDGSGAAVDVFPDTQNSSRTRRHRPALPDGGAACGLLPAAGAAGVVHRDGEVAVPHAGMEAVAHRHARRQEPAAAR